MSLLDYGWTEEQAQGLLESLNLDGGTPKWKRECLQWLRSWCSANAKDAATVRAYGHVALHDDKLVSIEREQTQFTVTCASGFRAVARKVLLTTGLQDEVPQIDGIDGLYGRTVHHCPYCDGYENSHKPIAIYGKGDKGAGLALMMKQWSPDVILYTDGKPDILSEMRSRLEHGIKIYGEK